MTAISDPSASAFYGRRYVLANLEQRQISMVTRASVTFTPSLSLEVYAQPLLASADYHDFEEFAVPRQLRKLIYGRDVGTICPVTDGAGAVTRYDFNPTRQVSCALTGTARADSLPFQLANPNFNFRSLRGTGVLRWEWRPGSTAYLVWTQTRSGMAPLGDLDFSRDRSALFGAPADNIFVFKVSYWLGM
ncbi:MAG: hypothetical protein NVS1B4_18280 [Gemmatimonadaceae bacterium]